MDPVTLIPVFKILTPTPSRSFSTAHIAYPSCLSIQSVVAIGMDCMSIYRWTNNRPRKAYISLWLTRERNIYLRLNHDSQWPHMINVTTLDTSEGLLWLLIINEQTSSCPVCEASFSSWPAKKTHCWISVLLQTPSSPQCLHCYVKIKTTSYFDQNIKTSACCF